MFEGVSVALVTPFRGGAVDVDGYRRVVRHVLDQGVQGLVPTGSTGESPTLDLDERLLLWRIAVEEARGRAFVVAGTGTNDTRSSIELTRAARACGVDGCMLVTPYYNKPTPRGQIAHFRAVADAVDVPLVLYNVPGRTGTNLLPSTLRELAPHPRIVAVKEASGNPDQTTEILLDGGVTVLSGDDSLTLPLVAAGARGIVSVLGHLAGGEIVAMLRHFASGHVEEAAALHRRLFPLTRALFLESNPSPVKAGLAMLGIIQEELRPPLVAVGSETREAVRREMARLGLPVGGAAEER